MCIPPEFKVRELAWIVIASYKRGYNMHCEWYESNYRDMATFMYEALVKRFMDMGDYCPKWLVHMYKLPADDQPEWRITYELGRIVNVELVNGTRILGLGRVDPEYMHD